MFGTIFLKWNLRCSGPGNSRTLLFERQFEIASDLAVQAESLIGEVTAVRDIFADVAVTIRVLPVEDELLVLVGSLATRMTWSGDVVAGPTLPLNPYGDSLIPFPTAWAELTDDDTLRVLGPSGIYELKWPQPWPETVVAHPFQAFYGAGTPYLFGVHPDSYGNRVLIGTSDGQITNLDVVDEEIGPTIFSVPSRTNLVDFRAQRAALATDNGITLVSLIGEGPLTTGFPRASDQPTASISNDGQLAYLGPGGAPGSVAVFRIDGNQVTNLRTPEAGTQIAGGFAPTLPESMQIWTVLPDDGSVQSDIYLVENGHLRFERSVFGPIGGVAFDQTVEYVAVADWWPKVIDRSTGEQLRELPEPEETTDVTFHPIKGWLLASSASGQAVLYETTTWKPSAEVDLTNERISVANWSQDGTLLATADFVGGSIVVRDGTTFEVVRSIDSPSFGVETWNDAALIFSADNQFLLTNIDNEGQFWDVASGERIGRPFPNHPQANSGVNWGTHPQLITTTENSALVWNLNVDTWPALACRAAGSEITAQEWAQWGPNDEPYRRLC